MAKNYNLGLVKIVGGKYLSDFEKIIGSETVVPNESHWTSFADYMTCLITVAPEEATAFRILDSFMDLSRRVKLEMVEFYR